MRLIISMIFLILNLPLTQISSEKKKRRNPIVHDMYSDARGHSGIHDDLGCVNSRSFSMGFPRRFFFFAWNRLTKMTSSDEIKAF